VIAWPATRRALVVLLSIMASVGMMLPTAPYANAQAVNEFPIPTAGAVPHGIIRGPDSALWFTESAQNRIGRIDPVTHFVIEFVLPTPNNGPETITVGPDNAMWFTEQTSGKIGRITTAGVISEFTPPTPNAGPHGLTVGPDGAIWFSERNPPAPNTQGIIGRIDVNNHGFQEFPLPAGMGPEPDLLVTGPDGAIWFGERNGGKIGRITTGGVFSEFVPPTTATAANQTLVYTHGITVGPDGAIWFTEQRADKIGRIDVTTHAFTEFPLPTQGNAPHFLLVGPDSNLWFTEQGVLPNLTNSPPLGNKIGRITTHGVITEFPVTTPASQPYGMTVGPDLAMWFTEAAGNNVGRITVPAATPTPTATPVTVPTTNNPPVSGQAGVSCAGQSGGVCTVTSNAPGGVAGTVTGTLTNTGNGTFTANITATGPTNLVAVGGTPRLFVSTTNGVQSIACTPVTAGFQTTCTGPINGSVLQGSLVTVRFPLNGAAGTLDVVGTVNGPGAPTLTVQQAIALVQPSGQQGNACATAIGQACQVTGATNGTGTVNGSMQWNLTATVPAGVAAGVIPVAVFSTTAGLQGFACAAVVAGVGTVVCAGTTAANALQGSTVTVVFGAGLVSVGTVTGPGGAAVLPLLPPPPPPPIILPPPPPPLIPAAPARLSAPAARPAAPVAPEVPIIPETDTMLLLGAGLVGVGLIAGLRKLRRRED
jgi:virginiamycin B lyase